MSVSEQRKRDASREKKKNFIICHDTQLSREVAIKGAGDLVPQATTRMMRFIYSRWV